MGRTAPQRPPHRQRVLATPTPALGRAPCSCPGPQALWGRIGIAAPPCALYCQPRPHRRPRPRRLLSPAVVLIRGNARTRQSLIGQRAVVRRAVGLGGWHWLVSRVRGRRSCARAGAPPAPCAMRGTLPAAHQFAHPLAWRAAGAAVWRGGQAAAQRARGAGAAHRRRDGEAAGRQGPCRACPSLPAPAALVQACTALWRHAVLQNRFIQPKVLLPQLLCAILALQDMSEEEEERRREQQQSVARGYAYEPAEPHAEGGLERRLIECLSAACWLFCVLPACRWRPTSVEKDGACLLLVRQTSQPLTRYSAFVPLPADRPRPPRRPSSVPPQPHSFLDDYSQGGRARMPSSRGACRRPPLQPGLASRGRWQSGLASSSVCSQGLQAGGGGTGCDWLGC